MEAHDYWKALLKSWALILVLVIVGGAAGAAYAFARGDSYEATTSVFVSTPQGATTDQLSQGSQYTQNLVASYTKLAASPKVLDPVIDELGLSTTAEKLATHVAATNPLDTVIVQVVVTESSATSAAAIANAIADSLRTVTIELSPVSSTGAPQVSMTVIATADTPTSPSGPNRPLIIASGLVIGLLLGIIVAVVRAVVDTRLRTTVDVERASAAPVIGTVRRSADHVPGIVVADGAQSPLAEDYRRVSATLPFAGPEGATSVLVAPVTTGVPAAEVGLNVALASAERGARVLIVDADLRTRRISELTATTDARGLADVLSGAVPAAEAIVEWRDGVDVLPAGAVQSNPHFALGRPVLAETLATLADAYDLIVVDAPAALEFADALTLSRAVDSTLVVASARSTRRQQLTEVVEQLEAVDAHVTGVVLSEVGGRAPVDAPTRQTPSAPTAPPAPAEAPVAPVVESPATKTPAPRTTPSTARTPRGTAAKPKPTTND